jgi:hypothetical protein
MWLKRYITILDDSNDDMSLSVGISDLTLSYTKSICRFYAKSDAHVLDTRLFCW